MNNTELTFNLREKFEVRAFIQLIRELNECGVPYTTQQSDDSLIVRLEITTGY